MPKKKPRKPRPDFPLFPHQVGQWAKKIRGKTFYFGPWADPQAALNKYLETRDDLQAGRKPRQRDDQLTLRDLSDRFLTAKELQVEAGELTRLSWSDYHRACAAMIQHFGAARAVADLRPEDFAGYRAKLAKTQGPTAIGNSVIRTRSVFKWAFDNYLIDSPVRFGTGFSRPSARNVRRAKKEAGGRMIEADEIRKLLGLARQPLKAMILLGINCGFGQADIAALPLDAIDLDGGWVNFPRPKTETDRRCPLWPETAKALREAIKLRPEPSGTDAAGLAFLTHHGNRWIRHSVAPKTGRTYYNDYVAAEYVKVIKGAGLKRRGAFYNLRHAFRTVADEVKDRPAIDTIMGHVDPTMAVHYRERISDERLRAVADAVRQWLFSSDSRKASTTGATK